MSIQKVKTWTTVLTFFILCLTLSAQTQQKDRVQAIRKMLDEAVVLDQRHDVLQADTTLLFRIIHQCEKHQIHPELILAHKHIGDYFYINANYPKAVNHYQIALKATQHLSDPERDIQLLEIRLGHAYSKLGRLEDAQAIYLKYLAKVDQQLQQVTADSAKLFYVKSALLINLGNIYASKGNYEQAIPSMKAAQGLIKRAYYENDSNYEHSYKSISFHLGSVYLFKGDGKLAKPYILEYLAYIEEQNQDKKTLAQTYGNLAYCEYLLNNFEEAYHYYFKSLDISEQNNYPGVSLITYKDLSDTYQANGQVKAAIQYLNKHYFLKDCLQGVEVQQNIDNLRVAFKTEQKEQEIIRLHQENQIAKQQRWLLIAALLIAFLIGLFSIIYFINLNKHRKKETELQSLKLAHLNQELEYKKQDMTRLALEISNKQELAKQLSDQVQKLNAHIHPKAQVEWRKLGALIQSHLYATEEQKVFHENVEAINHAFYDKLSKQFPNLSKSDRELCSFIRLGLSNKEIAALRNVSPEAIRSSRFRLRKKLQVESKKDVEVFLQGL